MKNYKKNKKLIEENYSYDSSMEHDDCGVGIVAATEGKNQEK